MSGKIFISPLIIIFIFIFIHPAHATKNDIPFDFMPNSSFFNDLSRTYGFVKGQNKSLSLIQKKFPDLRLQCIKAKSEFDLKFKTSYNNLEKILKDLFGEKWEDFNTSMENQINNMLIELVFSRPEAEKFLEIVEFRAKGRLESPIIETLLICNPEFIKKPNQEINMGFKHTFRTKDHSKAKGLELQVEYPMSWSMKEGKRPNIIKFFSANNGKGPASFTIMTKDLLAEPDSSDYKNEIAQLETLKGANELASDFFSESSLIDMAKSMGIKNVREIKTKRVVLDRWPGAIIEFKGEQQRVDITVKSYFRIYVCLYKNYMIFIQCGVWSWPWDKDGDFQNRINSYVPVFRSIAYNFVIQSQY
jgi:hypothetical protein